jgi:hypothetical protein
MVVEPVGTKTLFGVENADFSASVRHFVLDVSLIEEMIVLLGAAVEPERTLS